MIGSVATETLTLGTPPMAVKDQGFGMIVDTSADFARTSCDGLIVRGGGMEREKGERDKGGTLGPTSRPPPFRVSPSPTSHSSPLPSPPPLPSLAPSLSLSSLLRASASPPCPS